MASAKRPDNPSLLLLPFPPEPSNRQLLNAAFRPPLTAALARVKEADRGVRLVVAVVCSLLDGQFVRSKTISWSRAQSVLAGIYHIISLVCAQLSIAVELDAGPGSVDTTVVLVDHDRKRRMPDARPTAMERNNTILVDLATFASAYHPWKHLFHVETEAGLQLYRTYLSLAEGRQTLLQEQLIPVEGGLTMNMKKQEAAEMAAPITPRQVVCLGGTFDHLHVGHKLLLTAGALLLQLPMDQGKEPGIFIIGLTGDELLREKKYSEWVQCWEDRARTVIRFLATLLHLSEQAYQSGSLPSLDERDGDFRARFRNGAVEVRCVRIRDAYGPTIRQENMDALVVSGETRSGGKAVNDRRREQGWRTLDVFEVDVLDADEIPDEETRSDKFASKISSTAIRKLRADAAEKARAGRA